MKLSEILILTFVSLVTGLQVNAQNIKPTDIVQGQLEAYNNQDIESFLSWYAEDVEVYNFPNDLVYKGKEKMRERYSNAWRQNPQQKAGVTDRINVGSTVIDKEHITGRATGIEANVIAIYKIEKEKIKQVYFVRE
jgi:hypothetical protein